MTTEGPTRRPAAGAGDPWTGRAVPAALALLLLLFLQGLIFIGESSQTSDEAAHIAAGYSYLETADFRLNPEHPPLVKEWAALPLLSLNLDFPWGPLWEQAEEWNIGRIFVHENRVPNDTILLFGRIQVLVLSLVLGWFMFRWGRTLFGPRGALLGLALYALDPNVVAHSSLVTTDIGVTLFMFLTVYALWSWSERPGPRVFVLCGIMAGAAFASKYTSFWLLPILVVLMAALFALRVPLPSRPWARRADAVPVATAARRIGALLLLGFFLAIVAFFVLASTYGFVGLKSYLVGLERGLRHSGVGHNAYLMGQYSDEGWWYYFLVAYAIKTPIGTLLILACALAALLLGRRMVRLKDELFLAVPIVLVVLITCLWKVNIGLRHILPLYPFLYVAAGRLLMSGAAPSPRRRWPRFAVASCLAIGLAWNVVAAGSIVPFNLAYFNELVGGPRNGHLYLLDSNLDWGQAAKALRRYVEAEHLPIIYCAYAGNSDPWYYSVRYQYAPGSGNLENAKQRPVRVPEGLPREVLAVSAMVLHSVQFSDNEVWAPLRRQQAIAMPGYAFLVYDITRNADAHAYIATLYLNFGMDDLADYEAHRTLRLAPGNAVALAVLDKLKERASAAGQGPGG